MSWTSSSCVHQLHTQLVGLREAAQLYLLYCPEVGTHIFNEKFTLEITYLSFSRELKSPYHHVLRSLPCARSVISALKL